MMVHYHTVMVWFWFSRNFDAMMLLPYSHCLVVANGTCLVVAIVSNDVLQLVQLTYDVSSYYSNDIVSIIISYPIYIYTLIHFYTYISYMWIYVCTLYGIACLFSLGTSPARILDASSSLRQDTGHGELWKHVGGRGHRPTVGPCGPQGPIWGFHHGANTSIGLIGIGVPFIKWTHWRVILSKLWNQWSLRFGIRWYQDYPYL